MDSNSSEKLKIEHSISENEKVKIEGDGAASNTLIYKSDDD